MFKLLASSFSKYAIIALLVACGVLYYLYLQANEKIVTCNTNYASLVGEINKETERVEQVERRKEAVAKAIAIKQADEAAAIKAKIALDEIRINNLTDELRDSYETNKHITYSRDLALDSLRSAVKSKSDSSGPSGTSAATGYTEARRECDATRARLRNLEEATALTTLHFNTCANWVDNVCNSFGCGERFK